MNNPKLLRFTEWLATSEGEREPPTQKELALELGVAESQLSIWKRDLQLQSAKPSDVKALFEHIVAEAKKGTNAQMAKLAWEITHPKDEAIGGEALTADEYINIGIKTLDGLREQYRQGDGICPVCGRCKEVRHQVCLDTESGKEEDREVATVAVPARLD